MSKLELEGAVLIVGGSGYLGLHLLQYLATYTKFRLAYTFNKSEITSSHPSLQDVQAFHVDLRTGVGLDQISKSMGPPAAVVNCAAISVPRECEENPQEALEVNVPRSLTQWLKSFAHNKPLLIHLSTDQVYEGIKSFYKEEDETKPVNVYGESKVEAEKHVKANWQNYVILRSSIIYGPPPIIPLKNARLVQWIDTTLAAGKKADFFSDEFRCPVYVKDVVKVVLLLIANLTAEGGFAQLVLNVGGPDRLSRAAMAEVVAKVKGYDISLINHVKSSTVTRSLKSPPDISMDVTKLESLFGLKMMKFADGVEQTVKLSEVSKQ